MAGVLKTQNETKTLRSLLRQAPVFLPRYPIATAAPFVPFSYIAWYNESNHTAKRGHVTDEME